jgi:signal transduction histidine kinase
VSGAPTGVPAAAADDAANRPAVDAAAAAAWIARLYELGRPATHEVRNALNGLAVNLEVVRSRAARPDAPAASVARFADAAVEQLDHLASLAEALLSFMRPVPEPVDVALLVQRLGVLLSAIARGDGGTVTVSVARSDVSYVTGAPGDAVRLAITAMLLAAFDRAGSLSCELVEASRPELRLRREGAPLPPLPHDVAALVAGAGARLDVLPDGWVAVFPPPSAP